MRTTRALIASGIAAGTLVLATVPAGAGAIVLTFDPTSPEVGDTVTASSTSIACTDGFEAVVMMGDTTIDSDSDVDSETGEFEVTFDADEAGTYAVTVSCGTSTEITGSVEVAAAPTTTTSSTTSTTVAPSSTSTTTAARAVAATPAFTG